MTKKKKEGEGEKSGKDGEMKPKKAPHLVASMGVLDFHWEPEPARFIAHLEVMNMSKEPVFYKLKTTHPEILRVHPAGHGFLKPGETGRVNVTSKEGWKEKEAGDKREKYILVQSAFVGDKKDNPRGEKKLAVRERPPGTPYTIEWATVQVMVMDPLPPPPPPWPSIWLILLGVIILILIFLRLVLNRAKTPNNSTSLSTPLP